MNILYQDEHLVVFEKLSGMHVHPPEDSSIRVHRSKILLYQMRDFLGKKVFPVHRLDVATSGVLVMALSSASASLLCRQFQENRVEKSYRAVVRGYVRDEDFIDLPLELDSTKMLVPAQTSYECLARLELAYSVTPKYPNSRYSMVRVKPHTGRYHQIRRHFNRISHPLIGDAYHGDSHHNRFFREMLAIGGLCLRAESLEFEHPMRSEPMSFYIAPDEKWQKIELLFREGNLKSPATLNLNLDKIEKSVSDQIKIPRAIANFTHRCSGSTSRAGNIKSLNGALWTVPFR